MVLIYDSDLNVKRVNSIFMENYGFDPVGLDFRRVIERTRFGSLDGIPFVIEELPTSRALRGETVHNKQFLITCHNSEEAVIETTSTPLRYEGRIIGVVTVWHDITEHYHSKETVQRAKEEWERTFDSVPDLIAILDEQTPHHACQSGHGRALEARSGRNVSVCPVPQRPFMARAFPTASAPIPRQWRSLLDMWLRCMKMLLAAVRSWLRRPPCLTFGGEIYATVHVARDITKQKQTEMALRENEERLRLFIEHAPAALAMFDREMRYIQVSKRWRNDYGLNERELIGECQYEIFPDISVAWKDAYCRGLAGEVLKANSDRSERPDGSVQCDALGNSPLVYNLGHCRRDRRIYRRYYGTKTGRRISISNQ